MKPPRDAVVRPSTGRSPLGGEPRHRPRKRFGQHFLERAWADKVVAALDPSGDEIVIEIGPGRGVLTRALAARAGRVLAYEIDHDLASELTHAALPNVSVRDADFLQVSADTLRSDLSTLGTAAAPLRAAGNLPYNVASPILFHLAALVAAGLPISDATVMLQREVADRLTAHPGTKEYGVLSILLGHVADVQRLLALPPGAFRPPPKVHSAVVRLRFHPPDPPVSRPDLLAGLVHAIFTRRRKTLFNALGAFHLSESCPAGPALAEAGLDGRRRPETFSIAELVRLADVFARSCVIVSL